MTATNPPGTTLDMALEEMNASPPLPQYSKPILRDVQGKFIPGTVGNVGINGRQTTTFFRMRCRAFMEERGWAALEALATNHKKPEVQHRAIELIAAYAYGRPAQRHEVLVDDTGARSLVDGLTQMMAEQIARRRVVEGVLVAPVLEEGKG